MKEYIFLPILLCPFFCVFSQHTIYIIIKDSQTDLLLAGDTVQCLALKRETLPIRMTLFKINNQWSSRIGTGLAFTFK